MVLSIPDRYLNPLLDEYDSIKITICQYKNIEFKEIKLRQKMFEDKLVGMQTVRYRYKPRE